MISKLFPKITISRRIKTIPHDPFMSRLGSSVIGCGMLPEGNKYLMDYAIKNMPEGGDILEIGSFGGLSAIFMTWLIKKHNRTEKLLSCDPWIYEGYEDHSGKVSEYMDGRDDVTRKDYVAYVKQSYINANKLLNKDSLPHAFEMTSNQFFENYHKGSTLVDLFERTIELPRPISFAYIDGDHSYEATKNDSESVSQFLLKGGFVLFDNAVDGSHFGSAKFMSDMKSNRDFKLVDKNPTYLFQKIR